ncbi:MAG: EF-hand domain-containing protein [Pseudomonadota bacterium]
MTAAINGVSSGSAHAVQFDPSKGAARFAAKVFGDLDTNKDGKLTKDEFVTGLASKGVSANDATKQFDTIDKNKSGSITQSDLESAIKSGSFGPPRPAGGAGGPGGHGGAGRPAGAGGPQSESAGSTTKTYAAADTNKDGTVSAAEQLIYDLSHQSQTSSDSSKVGTNIDNLA